MRRRSFCTAWFFAILPTALLSSTVEVRAGTPCTPTLTYKESRTAIPTQLVQIPQFNPVLGELCFAVVRITASYDALIKVENMASSMSIVTVTATETVNVDVPAFMSPQQADITNADETFTDFDFVAPWDGGPAFSFVGPDTATFTFEPINPRVVQIGNSAYNINDTGFANFTGNGNIPEGFNVTGMSDFSVNSNAGDYNAQATLRMSVNVSVEYHYLPESTTLIPLIGGLFFIRRRRPR